MKKIGLASIFLALLLAACQPQANRQRLSQLEADFSVISHPPNTEQIDSFSGVGNFSGHRQIFGVEGDYCDLWAVELRRYSGEAQAVYDFYHGASQPPILMFVERDQSETFVQNHKDISYDSYADAFALQFFQRQYLWRAVGVDAHVAHAVGEKTLE